MRAVVVFCLGLLLVGCGAAKPTLQWPAHIDSLQGFDDASANKVKDYLNALNTDLGSDQITFDSTQGSPIIIKVVTDFSNNAVGAEKSPSSTGLKVAGRATLADGKCTIEIGDFIIQDTKDQLFKPVLWHEMGHCAGLSHVSDANEFMSPTTVDWQIYSKNALSRFISSFLGSAGIAATASSADRT